MGLGKWLFLGGVGFAVVTVARKAFASLRPPSDQQEGEHVGDAQQPSTPPAGQVKVTKGDKFPGQVSVYYPTGTIKRQKPPGGAQNGSASWLANNPGNLIFESSQWAAREAGAFRDAFIPWGATKFAIFPDEKTGMAAIVRLLQTQAYSSKTIHAAMQRYAPGSDGNDPTAYAAMLARKVGVPASTLVSSLTAQQLGAMATEIRRIEGWLPGETEQANS